MAVRNSKVCPQNRNYLLSKRRDCVSTVMTGAIGPTSVQSHGCAALMDVRGSTRSCCMRLLIRTMMPLQLPPTLLKLAGLLRQVTLLAQLRRQGSRQLCFFAVKVRGKGNLDYINTCNIALLDSGSTRTFCSEGLRDQLGLEGTRSVLSLTTASGEEDTPTFEVALELATSKTKGRKRSVISLPRVYTLPISCHLWRTTLHQLQT